VRTCAFGAYGKYTEAGTGTIPLGTRRHKYAPYALSLFAILAILRSSSDDERIVVGLNMDVTLEAIAGEISKQLGDFEKRFVSVVETAKNELIEQAKGHHEALTEQAKGHHDALTQQAKIHREALKKDFEDGLDGYGGTLEAIQRDLSDLNRKFDTIEARRPAGRQIAGDDANAHGREQA
jgi:hypothetical protein